MRRIPTPDYKIIRMYKAGKTIGDIVAILSISGLAISGSTVGKRLKQAGVILRKGSTPERLFWKKVNKHGPVANKTLGRCWVFTGSLDEDGYGTFQTKHGRRAHRFAFSLKEPLNKSLCVLHKCDTRSCVRYSHLFQGTPADNTHDMITKGRHHSDKLTLNEKRILSLYRQGWSIRAIANKMRISYHTILRRLKNNNVPLRKVSRSGITGQFFTALPAGPQLTPRRMYDQRKKAS